jgi:hypothetical protein
VVNFTPRLLFLPGKEPRCSLNSSMGGSQHQSGRVWRRENFFPCRNLNPGPSYPQLDAVATALSQLLLFHLEKPKNVGDASGGQSPSFHLGGQVSMPGRTVWNFWWIKWHCDRVFSKYFCFSLSVPFHPCSILIFIISVVYS